MVLNYNSSICLECNEAIFNPLCPYCLAEQIDSWLCNSSLDKNAKLKTIKFLNKIKHEFGEDGVSCVTCRDNSTEICPYCFTEKVYNFILKFTKDEKVLESFLTHFNYDFDHTGYERDFEDN